jgi:inositol 3-alpha-galactosyltransferase
VQGSKPWRFTGEEANMNREDIKMLVKKWSDIYNDESLDYKGDTDEGRESVRAALAESGTAYYPRAPSAA